MKVICPQCKGKGEYKVISESFKDQDGSEVIYPVNCSLCEGAGEVDKSVTAYRGKRKELRQ